MSDGAGRLERASVRRFAQSHLSLGGRPATPEATALVAHCLDTIVLPSLPPQQKRPSSVPAIERAAAGTIGGLVASSAVGDGWARRPLAASSFTGELGISRGQFLKVYRSLEANGLIETAPGYFDRSGPVTRGAETRVRLTGAGKALIASFGVKAGGEPHFRSEEPLAA